MDWGQKDYCDYRVFIEDKGRNLYREGLGMIKVVEKIGLCFKR